MTCVLSGMLVPNVPLPAASTCKTRLFGFEKSATTRILLALHHSHACGCTAHPRYRHPVENEIEMSAEPFDWNRSTNNVYGEFRW